MKTKLLSLFVSFFILLIPFKLFSQATCTAPANLSVAVIGTSGATFSWSAPAGAIGYSIQYRPVTNPESAWITLNTQATSIGVTNLACGTVYQWHVATYCGTTANPPSPYSDIHDFTTLPCLMPCLAPTGLSSTNITSTAATFSWTAVAGAVGYVVQYRPFTNPESAWITLNASATSITLTNLVCGTVYQWHVASHCGNSGTTATSPYSDIHDFTTASCTTTCVHPTGLTTTNINTTGATFSWTAVPGAIGYSIQYRPVTTPESAWITLNTQSTSISITNLVCGSHYQWHVASYCGSTANPPSLYSDIIDFTTAACTTTCAHPEAPITTNVTATGATFSWTAPAGALGFIVQYRPITTPESAWITVNTQLTSISITNLTCGSIYQWHVATICSTTAGGTSLYTTPLTFTTLPCTLPCVAPTGLAATNITTTAATFSWAASAGAVGYVFQYRPITSPESAWITLNASLTSITVTNLVCGTHYQWHVASHCANAGATTTSPYSDIHDFTTTACTTTCEHPSGFTTTNISATTATLSWTAVAGAAGYIVQYHVITTPASAWINVTAQTNSVTLSNLACGTTYEWHVATVCGNSATIISPYSEIIHFTTTACTTTCAHPEAPITTNVTATGATFSWTAPAGALGFIVQYRPITTPESAWITVNTQLTSISITNLICGSIYQWHVATICSTTAGGTSMYTTPLTFTTLPCTLPCVAPTGLTATNITTTSATFSWAASAGAVGYVFQYRPITSPESAWITLNASLTSITVTNLVCGTIYQWHVASHCANAGATTTSPYSDIHDFTTTACTTTCEHPSGFTTTNITTTGAILSWTAVTGAAGYIVQYHVITTPASAWINVTTQTNSVALSNLACGTTYEWHVATVCGNSATIISPYSEIIHFTTTACTTTCAHPEAPITTNVTATSATFSWTAPAGALGFIVQYRPITTPESAWITVNTQLTSISITNLICGSIYQWHVATICSTTAGGTSMYTTPLTFTTLPCTLPCVAPTGLTATNITTTSATFSWAASAGAVGYVFQYRPVTNPESAWITLNASSTSVTVTNLVCGTHYQWHVASHCANTGATATSPYSDIHDFTTPACTTTCAPPTVLETGNTSTTGATLSWVSPTAALGYLVQYRPVTSPESAWINLTTQLNSVTVTNLVCGTHYQWHVASYCGSAPTNISPYSQIINFTTLPCTNTICPVPGGLTSVALNASSGSRMLSWNSTGALSYNIRYRVQGTDTWTTTTSSTNTKLITGLQSLSHYQWQVQSVCTTASGSTFTSEWSLNAFFDTPQARTIFPNPASGTTIQLPVVIENEARMSITISDHLGRKVRSIDKTIPAGGEVLTINIANLEGGTYFVKIKGGGKNEVQRFVINR